MTQIIKITAVENFTIRAGSSPDIKVNEEVSIPPNHKGVFHIRKSLGNKSLNVPNSPFHEGWEGRPEICLINTGANDVDFRAGDELGELHIEYKPPSPNKGSYIELTEVFTLEQSGDHLQVTTIDGKVYKCKAVHQPIGNSGMQTIEVCPEARLLNSGPFAPKFFMQDYEFVRYTEKEEAERLAAALAELRFASSLDSVETLFAGNNDLRSRIAQVTQETLQKTEVEIEKKIPHDHMHEHVLRAQFEELADPIPKDVDDITVEPETVATFKIEAPFKYTNVGNVISVWLGNYLICTGKEIVVTFPDKPDEGFVYEASEHPVVPKPTAVKLNERDKPYFIKLLNPQFVSNMTNLALPPSKLANDLGQLSALVFCNRDTLLQNVNYLGPKFRVYLSYFIKSIMKQSDREGYELSGLLKHPLQHLRMTDVHRAPEYPRILKTSDNSWNTPKKVPLILAEKYPHVLVSIMSGEAIH